MRHFLYADDEQHTIRPSINEIFSIVQEAKSCNLLLLLVSQFGELDFESKRHATAIFSYLLKYQTMQDFVHDHASIMTILVHGYASTQYIFMYGTMLRDCLRFEALNRIFLHSPDIFGLFRYLDHANFEVAQDAFVSFREAITKHKHVTLTFLETHYDAFMDEYKKLMLSAHYITKRMAVKLLTELLLGKTMFRIMTRFVNEADKYEWVVLDMFDTHKNIQVEAFHLFKLFVLNPKKSDDVRALLLAQRVHLLQYLQHWDTRMYIEMQGCLWKCRLWWAIDGWCCQGGAGIEQRKGIDI